jgi:general secretion pathway protein N
MIRCAFILIATFLATACALVRAEDQRPSALPWLKLEDLSATRERPLFASTRRRPPPPPKPQVVTVVTEHPPETPQMVLTGIIVKPSETIVVLRNVATSESISLRSGESVGAWRVEAQDDHSVILTDGTRQFTLEMFTEQ